MGELKIGRRQRANEFGYSLGGIVGGGEYLTLKYLLAIFAREDQNTFVGRPAYGAGGAVDGGAGAVESRREGYYLGIRGFRGCLTGIN